MIKAIVPLCCALILAGRIFLKTEKCKKADQSIRAAFSKIEQNKRFSERFLMFWLRHPAILILVALAGCVLYLYLTY
jgi:hypothetical protein